MTHIATRKAQFVDAWNWMANQANANSRAHGFWDGPANNNAPTKIALMHSELSEALEALRKGRPADEHIHEMESLEVELADTVIRILDFAYQYNLDVGTAILKKFEYNAQRPPMHGGKAF